MKNTAFMYFDELTINGNLKQNCINKFSISNSSGNSTLMIAISSRLTEIDIK